MGSETAEWELTAIESRRGRLERMERDLDAIMDCYAGTLTRPLSDLDPEERHRVYRMLHLEVLAHLDKSLEVSGSILAGYGLGDKEMTGTSPGGPNLGALQLT